MTNRYAKRIITTDSTLNNLDDPAGFVNVTQHSFLGRKDLLKVNRRFFMEYLVVAGGGGSATGRSGSVGGGGGGGYIASNTQITTLSDLEIVIGAGGAQVAKGGSTFFRINDVIDGSNSTYHVAVGGGYGGAYPNGGAGPGASGGGGRGGGANDGASAPGGGSIPGQGFPGGSGNHGDGFNNSGGGGGGASESGTPSPGGRKGGDGRAWIDGVYYSGGGGGRGYGRPNGSPGLGGGPTANRGGGAGGPGPGTAASGVVIISYEGSIARANGGTETYDSANDRYIHTFTTSANVSIFS